MMIAPLPFECIPRHTISICLGPQLYLLHVEVHYAVFPFRTMTAFAYQTSVWS